MLSITEYPDFEITYQSYFGYDKSDNKEIENILRDEEYHVTHFEAGEDVLKYLFDVHPQLAQRCERIADLEGAISWYWPKKNNILNGYCQK